jgi:hypothetical protein
MLPHLAYMSMWLLLPMKIWGSQQLWRICSSRHLPSFKCCSTGTCIEKSHKGERVCPCPHFTCPKKIHHTPRNNIMHAPHTLLETLKASLMLTIWHRCQRGYNLQAYKTQTHFQSFVHGHACPLQVVIQWQHRQSVHPQKQQVLTPPLEIASVEIVSTPCVHTHASLVQESWSSK